MKFYRQTILFLIINGLILFIKAIPRPEQWVVTNHMYGNVNTPSNRHGFSNSNNVNNVNNVNGGIRANNGGYYYPTSPGPIRNRDPTVVVVGRSAIAERQAAERDYAQRMEEYDPEREL
jgi:hypothetical protein